MKKLFIIGNENISYHNNSYHSANLDFKSIVEGLSKNFEVNLLARHSIQKQIFKINYNKIKLSNNIFFYLLSIIKTLKDKNKSKYLIISISPYTFLAFLIIFFFSDNIYLYLRSNGFKEYEKILGKKWIFLYTFMYYFFLKKTKIISCEKTLVKKKDFFLVKPSELDKPWFQYRKPNIIGKKIKILYVGRIRIEKGIFNFLDLFSKLDKRFKLTIIGDKKDVRLNVKNVKFLKFSSNTKYLINQYDLHHILILPSYTESHPKVIYEALSRLRPVLIFKDIKHVIKSTKGIFICERDPVNFSQRALYIIKNYKFIQNQILTNKFPKKNVFIRNLCNILK